MARSNTHHDPDKDQSGCYKKGDIVVVMENGHIWGAEERPPHFVIVKCPGVAASTINNLRDEWLQFIDYEIIAQNAALDAARIKLFVTVPGAINRFGLTLDKVQTWFESWGGVHVSNTTNDVRFDITIKNAYKSAAFWGVDPEGINIVITETAYNSTTGEHTATIDITTSSVTAKQAKDRIEANMGVIIAFDNGVFTVTFSRTTMRDAFMADLRAKTLKTVVRRRWGFAASDVDTALAAGGVITVTAAQLAAKAIDKAAA